MKTPDGTYDALPFIDLREYGNTDYQQWLQLDKEIEIPLGPNDSQYQVRPPAVPLSLDTLISQRFLRVTKIRLS